MMGSAVARIPVVAVPRIGALAQRASPAAVNLLATSQPRAGISPSEKILY
jgi:hypothetical protein